MMATKDKSVETQPSHNHSTVDTSEPLDTPRPRNGLIDKDDGEGKGSRRLPTTRAANTPMTFAPDPAYLATGAGTAAAQTARPRMVADLVNGGWDAAPIVATGATAGIPGSYTPAGATQPASLAAMTGIVATPATLWTVGQYVVTGTGDVHWSGTAWSAGRAPV